MTVTFLTDPPMLRDTQGCYRLISPLFAMVEGTCYVVPQQFRFDGASIPRALWGVIGHPYLPNHVRPAALHDWMVRQPVTHPLSSTQAHDLFYHALRAEGVHPVRARLMWLAVRWFGPRFRSSLAKSPEGY